MVFLSGHNIYGMGTRRTKMVAQALRNLGLVRLLRFAMTKGKGYQDTTWDGVFYPFPLVEHVPMVRGRVGKLDAISTKTPAVNHYRGTSHLAVIGVKSSQEVVGDE